MSTRSEAILREARAIMLDLLCRVIPGHRGDEALYEATCWVDGLTKGTIEEYCALLQDATNVSTPIFIELAHAWRKADLPHPVPNSNLSMILVRALQRLPHASKEFSLLTVQVVIKCLLCDLKPLPLAVMIVEAAETEDMVSKHTIVGDLAEYARSIIYFDRYSGSDRNALAMRLLRSNFSEDSYPLVWLAPSPASRTRRIPSGVDCLSLMQQVTHMAAVFEADCRVRCCNVLRRLVPIAIVVS